MAIGAVGPCRSRTFNGYDLDYETEADIFEEDRDYERAAHIREGVLRDYFRACMESFLVGGAQ